MIRQGDVFWVELGPAAGSGPGLRHPYVVIQNDVFNASRIETVVVCSLTSKVKRAQAPGNVLLEEGEANLLKPSGRGILIIRSFMDEVDLSQREGGGCR